MYSVVIRAEGYFLLTHEKESVLEGFVNFYKIRNYKFNSIWRKHAQRRGIIVTPLPKRPRRLKLYTIYPSLS